MEVGRWSQKPKTCQHSLWMTLWGRSQTTLTRFCLFWTPTPLRWHFLPYKSWQNLTFLNYLPTSSCKRSLWTTPLCWSFNSFNLEIPCCLHFWLNFITNYHFLNISGSWDPSETSFAVLNKETAPDVSSVYLTVAADLVMSQVAEPVRFVIETK